METLALLFLTSAVSIFIQSTTGFGYGILFMAISPYFLPYAVAQVLNMSTSPIGNFINVSRRYTKINWRQVLVPLAFSTVACYISLEVATHIDTASMRRALGAVLFLLAIWFVFFSKKVKIRPTFLNGSIAGFISGIMTGLFAISGPPVVVYYLSALEDKEEYMATIQSYFMGNSLLTLLMRFLNGTFPAFSPLWYCACLAGMAVGVLFGIKFYKRLNGDMMKKYVYGFMAISGLIILIKG